MLVVGEKEAAEVTVNVNDRLGKLAQTMPLSQFMNLLQQESRTVL